MKLTNKLLGVAVASLSCFSLMGCDRKISFKKNYDFLTSAIMQSETFLEGNHNYFITLNEEMEQNDYEQNTTKWLNYVDGNYFVYDSTNHQYRNNAYIKKDVSNYDHYSWNGYGSASAKTSASVEEVSNINLLDLFNILDIFAEATYNAAAINANFENYYIEAYLNALDEAGKTTASYNMKKSIRAYKDNGIYEYSVKHYINTKYFDFEAELDIDVAKDGYINKVDYTIDYEYSMAGRKVEETLSRELNIFYTARRGLSYSEIPSWVLQANQ